MNINGYDIPEKIQKKLKEIEYSISVVEVNYLKGLIKELVADNPHVVDVKSSKDGKSFEITLVLRETALNVVRTVLRTKDRGGANYPSYVFKREIDSLRKKATEIAGMLNVCYSERDLMTDYYGLYRYSSYVKLELEDENGTNDKIVYIARNSLEQDGENSACHKQIEKDAAKVGLEYDVLDCEL